MAINMTVSILRPVGAGSKAINEMSDVRAIQNQLNGHMGPSRTYLAVDGKSGPKTCAAIRDFQAGVCGFRRPDGRVDPGGRTLAALNDPASTQRWARMSIYAPPAHEPSAGNDDDSDRSLTPRERQGRQLLRDRIEELRESDPQAASALEELISSHLTNIKAVVGALGTAEDGLLFARAVKALRTTGYSAREISILFGDLARPSMGGSPLRAVKLARRLGEAGPRLARVLKNFGTVMIAVSVLIAAFEAQKHFKNGDYGAAFGEVYKCAMSIAIPWAGLIDGLQDVIEALFPDVRGPVWSAFMKVLKAVNPIGLGAVGVDSYITTAGVIIRLVRTGKIDMRELDRLVQRMKSGPASFFTEVGEFWGDRMADMSADWFYENVLQNTDIFDG